MNSMQQDLFDLSLWSVPAVGHVTTFTPLFVPSWFTRLYCRLFLLISWGDLSLSLSRFPRLVECGLQFASRLMHMKIIKPGGVGGIRISWHTWQTNHSNPRRSFLHLPRRHLSGPWLRLRVHQLSYNIMSISLAHQHLHTALPLSSAAAHLQLLIIPFHHQLPVVAERALSCITELYY